MNTDMKLFKQLDDKTKLDIFTSLKISDNNIINNLFNLNVTDNATIDKILFWGIKVRFKKLQIQQKNLKDKIRKSYWGCGNHIDELAQLQSMCSTNSYMLRYLCGRLFQLKKQNKKDIK